jgi:hypothetical protein
MNEKSAIEASANASCTPGATMDDIVKLFAARGRFILQTLIGSVKVVEQEDRPQLRLEPISQQWAELSPIELRFVAASFNRINLAIQEGVVKLIPGFDSLKLVDLPAALSALAPGVFDAERIAGNPQLLTAVRGQWSPPGIAIDLTPLETNDLILIIETGGEGLVDFLVGLGVTAAFAAVIAVLLIVDILVLKAAKALSPRGAITLKITGFPPFVAVIPLPN